MTENTTSNSNCVIIGASHAGINAAFALRNEGWAGAIIIYDIDPIFPYHRPPLSKAYLTSTDGIEKNLLKSADSYTQENISLKLGILVKAIDRLNKTITLSDGSVQYYDKLIIATGARPIMPPIPGIDKALNLFPLRTATDVANIKNALNKSTTKKVVVIGGGYIGLETAASLKKLGAHVTILEREERILARVTVPEMAAFFMKLHKENGVEIHTLKNVTSFETINNNNVVHCSDNTSYNADIVIVGIGIHVNLELAKEAGLTIENGIKVDETCCTNDPNIYAIGDCTFHFNPHYNRYIRLESVQNAVDQAKITAAVISGKTARYDSIPWFWSDQYDVKLQIVGLSTGYNQIIIRNEDIENKFSIWYFNNETLLSVDAFNNAKAYVIGTKFIKSGEKIDKAKLADSSVDFKPANLLMD